VTSDHSQDRGSSRKREHSNGTHDDDAAHGRICDGPPENGQSAQNVVTSTEDSLARMLREVAAAPAMPLPGRPVAKDLPPGTNVDGRFTIVEKIGAGGMGVVYRADDTQLVRPVALKIVPLHEREVERAMREARTMAQLSHPNVVTVHDVGLLDEDHLFIAMEYVRGVTARRWLAAQARAPLEILRLYQDAAQGLVAAHAAGLVHRDFKPDNVLVGDDGRVRIADFGLARLHSSVADPVLSPEALHDTERNEADAATTQPIRSAIVGTPTYMAPEQRKGRDVDARADQFAYCVSLWEALFGRPPFPATELDASMTPSPPRKPGRARWVEPVLRRGLEFFPGDRFASMSDLLEAIERPRRRARRIRFTAVGAVAAAAMAVSGFVVADMRRMSSCEAGSGAAHEVWSDGRRESFEELLGAMDPNYGVSAATSFVNNVSRWADQWSRGYEEACLDVTTHDDGERALRKARLRCLEGQLTNVDTVLSQIEDMKPSTRSLARIEVLAHTLPHTQDCSRPEILAGTGNAGEMTEELVDITHDIRRLEAFAAVGDATNGIPFAEELLKRTEDAGLSGPRSEVFLLLGQLHSDAGDFEKAEQLLTEAFFAARAADSDHGAAMVAIKLIWAVGIYGGRYADARSWARHAEAAVSGRDVSPQLAGELECTLGVLAEYVGDYDEALRRNEACVPLMIEGHGPDHPHIANALNDRGTALDALGRLPEARATYDEALRVRRGAIKTPDAMLSIILSNRALVERQLGDIDSAVRDHREALAVMLNLVGPDSPQLVIALTNLASTLVEAEQFDEALVHLDRAKVLSLEHMGPDHPDLVYLYSARGEAYLLSDRPRLARVELEEALRIATNAEAFDPKGVASIREHIAALESGETVSPHAETDQ